MNSKAYRAWLNGERDYMYIPPRKPALWRRIVRAVADWVRGES